MANNSYPGPVRYLPAPSFKLEKDAAPVPLYEGEAWMREARNCIRELQLRVLSLERELAARGMVRLDRQGVGQRHSDPRPEDLIGPN